jgi:hypothetical protein
MTSIADVGDRWASRQGSAIMLGMTKQPKQPLEWAIFHLTTAPTNFIGIVDHQPDAESAVKAAIDAVAGISGSGRGRQCRDLAGSDQLPVRRARRACGRPRHDEQSQLRQRQVSICSGSPAGPAFAGTDAVQTHMPNTRLTDPEVLELRYPVVLEDFHVCAGSGGRGRWNAGDGILRTILSGHRRVRPFGLAGGESGELGENAVRRADGRIEKLQGCYATTIEAGGTIIIKTPDGGRLWGAGEVSLSFEK